MSDEDIIAKWIHRAFPFPPGFRIRMTQRIAGQQQPTRTLNSLKLALKGVCVKCNTGWMSQLQGRAKNTVHPMMAGHNVFIYPTGAAIITAWGVMWAMVMEWKDYSRSTIFYTQAERDAFRERLTFPDATFAWLARYDGSSLHWSNGNLLLVDLPPDLFDLKACVTTFSVFHLMVQILTIRKYPKLIRDDPVWQDKAIRLWPQGVLWPPEKPLTNNTRGKFAKRFDNLPPKDV